MIKVYSKLIKNSIMIPILLLILFIVSVKYFLYKESGDVDLSGTKAEVLIINRDMGSALSGGLIKYLGRYCDLVISDSSDAYTDYLTGIQYNYILDIPKFYQKDFMEGNKPVLSLADTGKNESLPLKYMLAEYLGAAQTYLNENRNITPDELMKRLDKDRQGKVRVYLEKVEEKYQDTLYAENFFEKASYILIFLCFFAIGRLSSYFGVSGIRKRHEIAPISAAKNNLRLFLSNLIFVLVCNGILFLLMFLLKPGIEPGWNICLYFINFLVYSFCILGLCYMIAALSLKYGINLILTLLFAAVMYILNGDFLWAGRKSLISIAEFTPVHWLKNINNSIGSLNGFAWADMNKIIYMMGVNILIAGAYFSISLVINKYRTEKE